MSNTKTPLFYLDLKSRPTGDYLTSKVESTFLCRGIERYYANEGTYGVKAWVEESSCPKTGFKMYFIRSNLKFDCSSIS